MALDWTEFLNPKPKHSIPWQDANASNPVASAVMSAPVNPLADMFSSMYTPKQNGTSGLIGLLHALRSSRDPVGASIQDQQAALQNRTTNWENARFGRPQVAGAPQQNELAGLLNALAANRDPVGYANKQQDADRVKRTTDWENAAFGGY